MDWMAIRLIACKERLSWRNEPLQLNRKTPICCRISLGDTDEWSARGVSAHVLGPGPSSKGATRPNAFSLSGRRSSGTHLKQRSWGRSPQDYRFTPVVVTERPRIAERTVPSALKRITRITLDEYGKRQDLNGRSVASIPRHPHWVQW